MEGATIIMKFSDEKNKIPEWILHHLRKYGNCCCGREIVKKIGREKIMDLLKEEGYPCILKIVCDNKYNYMVERKRKYPINAYYILEIETVVKTYYR